MKFPLFPAPEWSVQNHDKAKAGAATVTGPTQLGQRRFELPLSKHLSLSNSGQLTIIIVNLYCQ